MSSGSPAMLTNFVIQNYSYESHSIIRFLEQRFMQIDETRRLIDVTNLSTALGAKTPIRPIGSARPSGRSTSTPTTLGASGTVSLNSGTLSSDLHEEDQTIKPHTPMTNRFKELCRQDQRPTSSGMMTRGRMAREIGSTPHQPPQQAAVKPTSTGTRPKEANATTIPATPHPNFAMTETVPTAPAGAVGPLPHNFSNRATTRSTTRATYSHRMSFNPDAYEPVNLVAPEDLPVPPPQLRMDNDHEDDLGVAPLPLSPP